MNALLAMVLSVSAGPYPKCETMFTAFESQLEAWSKGRRHIGETTQEHNYHAVRKDGTVVRLVVLAAEGVDAAFAEFQGYTFNGECMMDGREAKFYFKVTTYK